jgi:hypothetical protein
MMQSFAVTILKVRGGMQQVSVGGPADSYQLSAISCQLDSSDLSQPTGLCKLLSESGELKAES